MSGRAPDPKKAERFQSAIIFLSDQVNKGSINPKPVFWHSFRVANNLYEDDQPEDVVIAGILHDALEDTKVSLELIRSAFGDKVANLVKTLTFDKSIPDKRLRYQEAYQRNLGGGQEALLIRTYDILDNSDYYQLAKSKEDYDFLLEKMKYFIDISSAVISDTNAWKILVAKYEFLVGI